MISTNSETIAAIATSYGQGSIAIVRISGDTAYQIALNLSQKESFTPRYATLTNIYNSQQEIIDQAIVIYFKNPHSFTGEDIVEIQSHGGLIIANMILKEVIALGARLAEPGEFSKRAFLSGKLDLTQAEAIAQMIEAKSEDAVKLLNRVLKGELKEFIEQTRATIIEAIAFIEVSIDYAEEDLPQDVYESIIKKIFTIKAKLHEISQASNRREKILNGHKISLVGKPNVGKSSLLNGLLNYERAIVSDIAGTTRDTVEERIHIGSHVVTIVDTAGIRESEETIEAIGIERSIKMIEESDIILAIFDGSKPLEADDKKIIDLLKKSDKEIIPIINKTDLPQKFHEDALDLPKPIQLSVKISIDDLLTRVEEILNNSNTLDETVLISQRQTIAVNQTIEALDAAVELLANGELELLSYELNTAIESLSSISRPYEYDQMLDVMFGEFCLGK